jgi:cytoskeletal protein CcmA (bactofilin family)
MARNSDSGHKTGDTTLSVIATGATITGELESNGIVKIEGRVVGSVRAAKQVLVAKGGFIDGDIITDEAIVGGEVHGGIYAERRTEIQADSKISGDIVTQSIVVHEGGEVNGYINMGNSETVRERAKEVDAARGRNDRKKPEPRLVAEQT